MAKRKFQLTEAERNALLGAYTQCKDGPTRTRYQAVRLYGERYTVAEIMQIAGCSRTSLMDWCRQYRADPIGSLVDKRTGGNSAKLTQLRIEDLNQRLHQYTPGNLFGAEAHTADGQFWTVEDLYWAVQQWYGVEYRSRSSYHRLFELCEFSYQKVEKVFKPRSQVKVAEFEELVEKN